MICALQHPIVLLSPNLVLPQKLTCFTSKWTPGKEIPFKETHDFQVSSRSFSLGVSAPAICSSSHSFLFLLPRPKIRHQTTHLTYTPPKTMVTWKCFSPWNKRETSTQVSPMFWGGNPAVSFRGCVMSGVLTNSTCHSKDPPKSPPSTSCLTLITKHPNQQWPASIDFSSIPGCNKNSQRQNDSDKGHVEIIFSSILIIKSHYIL